jgi:hypothetical protein
MRHLLAARGRRVVRQDRSWRDHVYGGGQVFDKVQCPNLGLMRHLRGLALIEVALLAGRMMGSARRGPLVTTTRRAHRIAARRFGAVLVAVPVTVVAVGAQEEHLAASPTGDKP